VSTACEADAVLKLMLVFELARTPGRWPIEGIRVAAPYMAADRVDGLVRTLVEGGWLELRASDRTYALTLPGLHVLRMLQVADFAGLASTNVVHRAALAVEFAARANPQGDATTLMMEGLAVQLENAVEEATAILRQGRARELIAWSQREHPVQLETIRQVLGYLQEQIETSPRQFQRIDRLHRAMQGIVKQHTGIHARLRDWNLERLYTTEAGYAVPELSEAVLGADADVLAGLLSSAVVQPRVLPPDLTTAELKVRLHGARRRLGPERDVWRYEPPETTVSEPYVAAAVDPAAALRARLTALLADRGRSDAPGEPVEPLEIEAWMTPGAMTSGAWDMALLCRLQAGGEPWALDDGRLAHATQTSLASGETAPGGGMEALVALGALRETPAGYFQRVRIGVEGEHD